MYNAIRKCPFLTSFNELSSFCILQAHKLKKRSVETPGELYMQDSNVRVIKRTDQSEQELSRVKRFKRNAPDEEEPELQRMKRFKRDSLNSPQKSADETELQRVKRNKRDADSELHRYKRQKRAVPDADDLALSRQKRFKRDLKEKAEHTGDSRMKRSGKKGNKFESDLKRSKRADSGKPKAIDEIRKHTKKSQSHRVEKRHDNLNKEYPIELHQKGHFDDIVKKAMSKFKRSKRRPKAKHSKFTKMHRSKRAGHFGIKQSSQMLKSISRDISRLQRLRRGIARNVVKSVKAHHAEKHN